MELDRIASKCLRISPSFNLRSLGWFCSLTYNATGLYPSLQNYSANISYFAHILILISTVRNYSKSDKY